MEIRRSGKLINGQLNSGIELMVELHRPDIEALGNPDKRKRYTMTRFGAFKHWDMGWGVEDKVHIRVEDPLLPEDDDKIANLFIDGGGDLIFTIWDSRALQEAQPVEVFHDLDTFVTQDSTQKLHAIGIQAVSLWHIDYLARQLRYGSY